MDTVVHQPLGDMVPGTAHRGTGVGARMNTCEELDDMFIDLEWDAAGDRVRKGASDGLPFGWLVFRKVSPPVVRIPVESVWVRFKCFLRRQRARKFPFPFPRAVRASRVRNQIDGSGRFFEIHGSRERDSSANICATELDLI